MRTNTISQRVPALDARGLSQHLAKHAAGPILVVKSYSQRIACDKAYFELCRSRRIAAIWIVLNRARAIVEWDTDPAYPRCRLTPTGAEVLRHVLRSVMVPKTEACPGEWGIVTVPRSMAVQVAREVRALLAEHTCDRYAQAATP